MKQFAILLITFLSLAGGTAHAQEVNGPAVGARVGGTVSYDVPDPSGDTQMPLDIVVSAPQTYQYGSHPLQALDVYVGTTGQTLVWLHGGGWEAGDKDLNVMSTFNRLPRALHAAGWTIISVNYRLSPKDPLEHMVDDFYNALVATAQLSSVWNVDLSKLTVGGFSAGAHIAGIGAASINDRSFNPPAGLPPIQAILSQDGNMMSSLYTAGMPGITRMLACSPCSPERIAQSDIVTYSDPGDPALYLIAGTHSIIPYDVQLTTRDMVRAKGQIVVFDGVDTGPEHLRLHDVQGLNWNALMAFLTPTYAPAVRIAS